ncbi:MAG TPA: TetR-like C-terminal domain-containing protein [Jatrophihabitantaceae bacterium]
MPRAGLTAERVVAAAADLADREGLDAVSLSALADQFGVRVPSLYKHVAGLDDLQRRLAAEGTAGLLAALRPAVKGKHGRDALHAVGTAYRRYAAAHPGRYQALQRAAQPGDEHAASAEQIVELLVGIMADYGHTGTAAVHAVRTVRSALHGFVELERIGGFGLPASRTASFNMLQNTLDRGLRE